MSNKHTGQTIGQGLLGKKGGDQEGSTEVLNVSTAIAAKYGTRRKDMEVFKAIIICT